MSMEIRNNEKHDETSSSDVTKKNGSTANSDVITEREPKSAFSKKATVFMVLASVVVSSLLGAFFALIAFNSGKIGTVLNEKISGFIGGSEFYQKKEKTENPDVRRIIVEDSAVTAVVEKATPSVVSIAITKEVSQMKEFGFPFFFPEFFDGQDQGITQKEKVGGGSGFFISEDGMIVTNKHVVEDSNAEYTVITNDGKEHQARVLARDPSRDIAIIKIEGSGFPVMPLGDSSVLKIGQTVIAIGNSLGEFSNTVSKGIISGLKRNVTAGSQAGGMVERLSNIIQTDAAINPGNSGGPLIDIEGNVVGVNIAIAENAQNVGFALPIDQVKRVINQVRQTGKISTPFLGVRYIPITEDIQKENNLPYSYGVLVQRGARLTDLAVIPGSPADKAGIVENDIILEIDGKRIDADNQLTDMIAERNIGDTINLKIWHKGDIKEIQVVLEERK